jgi:hypothetical protein
LIRQVPVPQQRKSSVITIPRYEMDLNRRANRQTRIIDWVALEAMGFPATGSAPKSNIVNNTK